MNSLSLPAGALLAAALPEIEVVRKVPGRDTDLLIIIGVCIVLLGVLAFGVMLGHRRSRRRHHRHETRTARTAEEAVGVAEAEDVPRHRHRRRRRRRDHRTRNPTLADTGGLPPPRPAGQQPSGL